MPGAVTETKSTSWKVTAQIVEERIKLKQNNSRIALALRNAKIHRPGLYLSEKAMFDCSGLVSTGLGKAGSNQKSVKDIPPKKVNKLNCKQNMCSETERDTSKNRSRACSNDVSGKTVSKLDSKKLRCSCQIVMDSNGSNRSKNPSEKSRNRAKDAERSDKTVMLKTVNVKPWANDGVKTSKDVEPHPTAIEDGDRTVKRNLSRLVSLLQECKELKNCPSAGQQNENGTLYQDDNSTVQSASQKLQKPGRIVYNYSHGSVSQDHRLNDNYLSGILLVTSKKTSNPWSFQQIPLINTAEQCSVQNPDFPVFERGPRLSAIKPVCHLCKECRKSFQNNVPRVHDPDMESENLTRLKHNLKLRERELLKVESTLDEIPQKGRIGGYRTYDAFDHPKSKVGETFSLPKLYLTHHSTATGDHQKPRRIKTKVADSQVITETCSSAGKRCCYKLSKLERLNSTNASRDKLNENSAKKCKMHESASRLLPQVDHLRVEMTPLRGFTPQCNDFPESPMLWRENTEIKGIEEETKDMEKELALKREKQGKE